MIRCTRIQTVPEFHGQSSKMGILSLRLSNATSLPELVVCAYITSSYDREADM